MIALRPAQIRKESGYKLNLYPLDDLTRRIDGLSHRDFAVTFD